jgi:TPR repeat protein/acetyl esterase/lipase
MSYLIQVWLPTPNQPLPASLEQASRQLRSLRGRPADSARPRFIHLAQRLAERDAATGDADGARAAALLNDTSRTAVWSIDIDPARRDELRPLVIAEANALGLNVSDGQAGEVYLANGTVLTLRENVASLAPHAAVAGDSLPSCTALERLAAAARDGDAQAQHALAEAYRLGRGVEPAIETALPWFEAAARQGYAEAQYSLGEIYRQGRWRAKDPRQALAYLGAAAEQGHALAQQGLGNMYRFGQGMARDNVAAVALFMLSQRNGNPNPLDFMASPKDAAQVPALLEQIAKPGNLLRALEQRQAQLPSPAPIARQTQWKIPTQSHPHSSIRRHTPFSRLGYGIGLLLIFVVAKLLWRSPQEAYDASACAGPPIAPGPALVQAREEALENGYSINETLRCIDKPSYERVQADQRAFEERRARTVAVKREKLAAAGASELAQARLEFQTKIALRDSGSPLLPSPPADLFVRSDYRNPQNHWLPGFVTPDPKDGLRHPAILWLTGGDTNSLSDFWTPGPESNDQSARAFREAGMVMYFPTLRGGNGGDGNKEYLLGEVDDVLAARDKLAKLAYVDPERIYLGGHSTGGTLALLAATTKPRFQAVFAFGPVARADRYSPAIIPIRFSDYDPMELKLRSPIHWLYGIGQPTYIIEGGSGTHNGEDFDALCTATDNPWLHCIRVADADHFSVLDGATRTIAAKLAGSADAAPAFAAEEFNP